MSAKITEGPHLNHEFQAINGTATPPIDNDTSLVGDTRFVGLACGAVPAADASHPVALIERGVCDFQVKLNNIKAAGYAGGIVFNRTGVDGCETLVTMIASGDIPFVFVSRTDGFRILGQDLTGYTCSTDGSGTAAPAPGGDVSAVNLSAFFDGWGYTHLYNANTMEDIGQYAIPEALDAANAQGKGDLSVHEVATDPDTNLAYLSYYSGGFRVLEYTNTGLTEVGHYIASGGNNFWGVEMWKQGDEKYVLASDRDSGLWIFQYDGWE